VDEDGRYLLEKLALSYVSDGATLASILSMPPTSPGPREDSLLAVGGIDYDARGTDGSGDGPSVASARGSFQDFWEPLRFTRKEAETVFALHRSGPKRASGAIATPAGEGGEEDGSYAARRRRGGTQAMSRAALHPSRPTGSSSPGCPDGRNGRAQTEKGGLTPGRGGAHLAPARSFGLVCAGANPPVGPSATTACSPGRVTWLDLTRCDLLVLSACRRRPGWTARARGC
jgi:hypothetical protein